MSELYHFDQLLLFGLPKECTSCHIEKPLDEFYKQSPRRGGYQAWCIACWKEKRQQKRLRNIQKLSLQERPVSQICIRCHIEKPIDGFYVSTASESGYRSICKDCLDYASGRKDVGKRRNRRNIPVTPGCKWCYHCKSEKPLSEFREDKTKWDGLCPCCNDCRKARGRARWHENREEWLPVQRAYHRNLYNSNLEYYRAYNREKSKQPRYRLHLIASWSLRRARKIAATVEDVDFRRIIKRDGYHCYICEQPIDPTIKTGGSRLSFDHVVPLARQGTHAEDNIKPAHLACNQRKNQRLLEEMDTFQRRGPDA